MLSQTKIEEEIKSEMHDFVEENKIHGMGLINSLLHLKITLKNMEEISIVKDLETKNKLSELDAENFMNWKCYKKIYSLEH